MRSDIGMKAVLYTMMVAAFLNPFASSSLTMSFPDMGGGILFTVLYGGGDSCW